MSALRDATRSTNAEIEHGGCQCQLTHTAANRLRPREVPKNDVFEEGKRGEFWSVQTSGDEDLWRGYFSAAARSKRALGGLVSHTSASTEACSSAGKRGHVNKPNRP